MISVCIATYNGEKFIKQQIDSILSQLTMDDELIISDDSSTDSTVQIAKSYSDKRILLLENNHFHSPIYNFENALMKATGDIIFTADQDDVWFSDKVLIMTEKLLEYDCIVSDAIIVDSNMNVLEPSFMEINHSKRGLLHNLIKNGYLGCAMAFNRKILEKALPFPKPIPMHDSWIGLIAEKYGKTLFLKEPLIYYRRHGNNVSQTSEKSNRKILIKVYDRFLILKNLIKR